MLDGGTTGLETDSWIGIYDNVIKTWFTITLSQHYEVRYIRVMSLFWDDRNVKDLLITFDDQQEVQVRFGVYFRCCTM